MADKDTEIERGEAWIADFADAMRRELQRQVARHPRNEWNGPVAVPIEQRRNIFLLAREGRPEEIGLAAMALWIREVRDGG